MTFRHLSPILVLTMYECKNVMHSYHSPLDHVINEVNSTVAAELPEMQVAWKLLCWACSSTCLSAKPYRYTAEGLFAGHVVSAASQMTPSKCLSLDGASWIILPDITVRRDPGWRVGQQYGVAHVFR